MVVVFILIRRELINFGFCVIVIKLMFDILIFVFFIVLLNIYNIDLICVCEVILGIILLYGWCIFICDKIVLDKIVLLFFVIVIFVLL